MPIHSQLLIIPAEVRLLVYTLLFAGVVLRPRRPLRLRSGPNPPPALKTTAILATCHLCHAEALPVFFKTCKFKLMTPVDKHAFLGSVPAAQYALIQWLVLNTPQVLHDWNPRFIAHHFPSLKTLEVPFFEVWNRDSGATKSLAEDSDKCAAIVQDTLTRLASLSVKGHHPNMIGDPISRHTTEVRRSYAVVLRTVLNIAIPCGVRYVFGDYNFDTGVWAFDDTRSQWSMFRAF